jgi:hypothetical protein
MTDTISAAMGATTGLLATGIMAKVATDIMKPIKPMKKITLPKHKVKMGKY